MSTHGAPQSRRPSNAIIARGVEISVKSVLYESDPQDGIPSCTVVLHVAFKLNPKSGLECAAIPINLKVHAMSQVSKAGEINPECYLRDHFTGIKEERILWEKYDAQTEDHLKPELELSVSKFVTVKEGGLGRITTYAKPVKKYITLVGQTLNNSMQVMWTFANPSKGRYPRNVTLMIIVKNEDSRNPYFPFALDLDKTYTVSPFGEPITHKVARWLQFKQLRPQPIHITGCWAPHIAQDALSDVSEFYDKQKHPKHIGLRAAQPMTLTDSDDS